MPFAASSDFLAVYWRAHLIAYDGRLYGDYLVNMGAHYLHALSLRLLDPLLPPEGTLWTDPWSWGDAEALGPQVLRAFVDAPDAYRTLFVLKLPYLAADLAAGALLVLLLRGHPLRERAWAFWMLSPIGLYAGYLFARYEAFPVALVVLALLLVERGRAWPAALALGVAVTTRAYPVLLVPVFALVAVRGVWRQAAWAGAALLPLGAVLVSNRLLGGSLGEFTRLGDFTSGGNLFAYSLPAGTGVVYVFFLALFALYGLVAGRAWGWWGPGPVASGELWVWLLVLHALLFGLAGFSPHYFMWITPFVALALARRPQWRGVLWLHLAQVAVALVIADLGGWGVATLAPVLPGLPAPSVPVVAPALAERLDPLLDTAFVALTALFALPALAELLPRRQDLLPASGPASAPA